MKKLKKGMAAVLVLVMAVVSVTVSDEIAQAAKKNIIKSVSVTKNTAVLKVGTSVTVKAAVKATKKIAAKDLRVKTKTSNGNIATVKIKNNPAKRAKKGITTLVISGKQEGTAVVTVRARKGNKKISKKIRVTVVTETVNPTDVGKPTTPVQSTAPASTIKPTGLVGSADPSKTTGPASSIDPIKTTGPASSIDPIKTTGPASSTGPTKPTRLISSTDPTQTTEPTTTGSNPIGTITPTATMIVTPTATGTLAPTEKADFKIRSDVGGTTENIKFTEDIRLVKLSLYASSLPTRDTISKYVWYKDGKEITKKDIKYDTTVNRSTLAVVEPGNYNLKITTTHSEYDPDTLQTKQTEKEYTSNTITVGTEIEQPDTVEVKWTTEVKTIEKQWVYQDKKTGESFLYPITLKRELVSFDPWPTTLEQVEYVIQNCEDPFVIGALYVVAMDNYNYATGQSNIEKRGITSMLMTNALATGAFIDGLDLATLGIQPSEKSTIQTGGYNDLGILAPTGGAFSGTPTSDKEHGYVYQYAPRTYCEGATNENGYAPNGKAADIADKTKWKIVVDQYPYCFDQVVDDSYGDADPVVKKEGSCTYQVTDKNGNKQEKTVDWSSMPALHKDPKYITVCPSHFQLESKTGNGTLVQKDGNQAIRVGLIWSQKSQRWVATDYAIMNGFTHEKQGLPAHYNYQGQGLFSNNYVAPVVQSGF